MKPIFYTYMQSPVGQLLLAGNDSGLKWISFQRGKDSKKPEPHWQASEAPFRKTIYQLHDYFKGKRRKFKLPLSPEGTPFQLAVWRKLQEIPYGMTASYGEIARAIGNPKAVRAVGAANGQNPLPIVIPCHRVIGADGRLTGYGGGLDIKEALLALERRETLKFPE